MPETEGDFIEVTNPKTGEKVLFPKDGVMKVPPEAVGVDQDTVPANPHHHSELAPNIIKTARPGSSNAHVDRPGGGRVKPKSTEQR